MQAYMYPMLRDDFELVETYQVGWADINTVSVAKGVTKYTRCPGVLDTHVRLRATVHASAAC